MMAPFRLWLYSSLAISSPRLVHGVWPFQSSVDVDARESWVASSPEHAIHPRSQGGNSTTTVSIDSNWYISVSIGTPPQPFLFLLDTGSGDIAVGSTLLPLDKQSTAPKYNPSKSTTAQQLDGYTYNLCFVSGYCSNGLVYRDTFAVGQLSLDQMYIDVQTNNSQQTNGTRSGTLGLSFDHTGESTKPKPVPNWLETVVPQLQSGVFTVYYDPLASNGTYDFGFIDQSKFQGSIDYASVNQSRGNGWTIPVSGQQLANGSFVAVSDWWVTVDTGTAGATVPREVANDYFAQIQGSTYDQSQRTFTYPCSSALKDFTFGLGDSRATISGENLAMKSIDEGNTCISKIQVGPAGIEQTIWGRTFIEQFFVIFDWDNGRVGFAQKAASTNASTSSSHNSTTTSTGTGAPPTHTSATVGWEYRFSSGGMYALAMGVVVVHVLLANAY